jgi:tetratricopeptide (TPR) repeat protein
LDWCRSLVRVAACALLVAAVAPVRAQPVVPAGPVSLPAAEEGRAVGRAEVPSDTAVPVTSDAAVPVVLDTAVPVASDAAVPVVSDTAAPVAGDTAVPTAPDAPELWGGYRSEIEQVWFETGSDLGARADRTHYRARELGVDNVEPAAHSLMISSRADDGLEAARLAVRLAPDLPIVHMALARASWSEGEYRAAVIAGVAGLKAIPRNLEASVWLVGSLLVMLATVLVLGSLAFIVCVGISVFSHAAHDLGDLISGEMPTFARVALLGSLLLIPLVLGEGLLGLILVFFALGFMYGGSHHRMSLTVAAALIVLGCYPVMRFAGMALTAMDSDPVAAAAQSVVRAMETPAEVDVLASAERDDVLALHALALHARRTAPMDEALERYQTLLKINPEDPVVLTNLANLRFRNGQVQDAITLYERAALLIDSAVVLFDLAQAHARSFQMEQFERAMSKAQSIDAEAVVALSRSGDPDFLADLPMPAARIRDRMLERARGVAFVQPVSRALMPGWLGRSWLFTASGFALALVVSLLVSGRYEHSSTCERCGRRICNRCDGSVWNSEICEGCHHLFHRPQATEPALRMARLAELREREVRLDKAVLVVSLLLPGAAGLLARRPALSFMGLLFFAWAVVLLVWNQGVVPDPLAVGSAGPLAFFLVGVAAMLGYLVVIAVGLAVRRSL